MPRKEKETIPYPSLNMENPTPKGLYFGLRKTYKEKRKEEKLKAKEKRKDTPI